MSTVGRTALAAAACAALLSGCATYAFPGSSAGRPAKMQAMLADGIDDAVSTYTFRQDSQINNRLVFVDVGALDDSSAGYVRTAFEQHLMDSQAFIAPERGDAEVILSVKARTTSADMTGWPKGFMPMLAAIIWYQEKMTVTVDLDAKAYNADPRAGGVYARDLGPAIQSSEYAQNWYLFGLIGPL